MKKKNSKPKDRFDEVLGAINMLDRKTGVQYDDLKQHIGLVAEQVAHNTEQISVIKETLAEHDTKLDNLGQNMEVVKYELRGKPDSKDILCLSQRVSVLERKVAGRK